MELKKIVESMNSLEREVLPILSGTVTAEYISEKTRLSIIEVMRALQWLQNRGLVEIIKSEKNVVELGQNGKYHILNGMPERRFLETIKDRTYSLKEIGEIASLDPDEINVCIGLLKRKAAIILENGKAAINENGLNLLQKKTLEENFLEKAKDTEIDIDSIKEEDKFAYDNLLKRKGVIKLKKVKSVSARVTEKGKKVARLNFGQEKLIETLTSKMIKEGTWKNKSFRRYDVGINVPEISGGRRHFVTQAINYIRKIWLELGFREMEGSLVQTSFWDLDALFVPQDHPARDMQDTFYIKEPKYGRIPPKFHKKIKEVHENGGNTGSKGWGYKWSEDMAKENLLRTHTTVLSAQAISRLKKEDLPAKFFSVKKVFRNETLSWKSLFEFIQVEGIVVDPDANFKHLKGYLKNFFAKMGFTDVRIRPAHFPYTEPSAEVEVFHPVKKVWVEIGGSGIFRPEVTKPLTGEEIPVLAWGLGLERTIMQYYGITDVRDLYKNDLKKLRNIPFWMK